MKKIEIEKIKNMLTSSVPGMLEMGIITGNKCLNKIDINKLYNEIQKTNSTQKIRLKNGLFKKSKRFGKHKK